MLLFGVERDIALALVILEQRDKERLEDTVLAITDIANETMDFVDDCMVRAILKKQERRAQKQ